MNVFPIPLGTKSHLEELFSKMYGIYSRDPVSVGTINWSMGGGKSGYLKVQGVTATLFVSPSLQYAYDLAIQLNDDGTSYAPNLNDFRSWLIAQDSNIIVPTLSSSVQTLTALVIPEGFYDSTHKIPIATSLNYLQMRVMALVLDLMAADTSNMFLHLSLSGAEGMWLDWIGDFYGIDRLTGEDNDQYRRRILRTLAQPEENNVAIASLVSETFGIPEVLVYDYRQFWAIIYVFGSLSNPNLVMPYVKSIAPAGVIWTGIEIPPGGIVSGALAGHVRAGNMTSKSWNGTSVSITKPPRRGPVVAGTPPTYWTDNDALPLGGLFAILH